MRTKRLLLAGALLLPAVLFAVQAEKAPPKPAAGKAPTVADAKAFLDEAEVRLLSLANDAGRASWVQSTFITDDTEILAAQANERQISAAVVYAKQATRFDGVKLPDDLARKMKLLKLSLTLATPSDPKESEELTRITAAMEGAYGKGKYCPPGKDKCLDLEDITKIMASSRDNAELLDVWRGWHTIAPPLRKDFIRYVDLANKGAREIGFADTGAMWRSKYDMPPDAFAKELDRLWEQVKPLYLSLHAYVRWKLREKYGDAVPAQGPIPAHLLGNMWAQTWDNVYPLIAPKDGDPGFDLTEILKSRKTDHLQMVRYGEGFFTSLGFDPLPKTFWDRSLFTKPRDREVVCHASAWDVDNVNDLRIKMCIDITSEDFSTIHHELGHNFYQRAYNAQPYLFRDSANDGFHEAVGDTIALSITPEYLVKLGLLKKAPDTSKDIGLLLKKALEKISFLPFGLVIDQWRWKVFSGEVTPDNYNAAWWELRKKYQGIAPAVPRSEADFDPAAKYHVAANVPYMRYFLADILQFQFHRALAKAAGCTEPLNRCSIYGNKEAGAKLAAMLAMGQSRPWPDALEAMTGQRQMDATAIRDYFAPLQKWLDEQNKGKPLGW
ncbi:MAG TPA: M2 family metallopeptidase [Thermoanaerobaculia bacterium]|jgi:peptidyl-dipeptidase A|nr:M2 family metallopeptidase [Thermoanaerobaculia bacterium]